MKLAFSTLGCPNWTIEEAVEAAERYGFQGIELRGIDGTLDIRKLSDFSGERIGITRSLLENTGIDVVSVDSSASFSWCEAEKILSNLEEAKDYILLASKLHAPLVRVFGGFIPEGKIHTDAVCQLSNNLFQLGNFAMKMGITVALETHDSFLTGKAVSEVMKITEHEAVGVVWDVSNCFWAGEPIEETARLLAPYLKLVHIKDSVWDGKEAKLTFIGKGDVPVYNALKVLKDIGYDGYLSYEWEKVWQPDLPEPEEAFPQYIKKMKEYLSQLS
jgi:sugar phosphate isomerase/epimerase